MSMRCLAQMPRIEVATDHVFSRMAAVARDNGARLVLAMDAVRGAIYLDSTSRAFALNQLAAELARKHGLPFVDLDPVFRADWSVNRKPFEFASDGHWNEHGHATAARAVAGAINAQR